MMLDPGLATNACSFKMFTFWAHFLSVAHWSVAICLSLAPCTAAVRQDQEVASWCIMFPYFTLQLIKVNLYTNIRVFVLICFDCFYPPSLWLICSILFFVIPYSISRHHPQNHTKSTPGLRVARDLWVYSSLHSSTGHLSRGWFRAGNDENDGGYIRSFSAIRLFSSALGCKNLRPFGR